MERELNRSCWSKSPRSFLCSDITPLQKRKGHVSFCFVPLFPNISPLAARPYERDLANVCLKKPVNMFFPLTATGSMSFKPVEDRLLYPSFDTFHLDILASCQYGFP